MRHLSTSLVLSSSSLKNNLVGSVSNLNNNFSNVYSTSQITNSFLGCETKTD